MTRPTKCKLAHLSLTIRDRLARRTAQNAPGLGQGWCGIPPGLHDGPILLVYVPAVGRSGRAPRRPTHTSPSVLARLVGPSGAVNRTQVLVLGFFMLAWLTLAVLLVLSSSVREA